VYQCTLKNVRLEIGLGREEIERIMAKFAEAGKAYYFREYIIIPKWLRHQKIKERSGLFLGMVKVLKGLPDEVKAFISDRRHYDYDVSEYIGNFYTPSQDPLLKNDGAFLDPPSKKGGPYQEYPPQTTLQKPHDLDLDLDSDLDSEFKENGGGKKDISSREEEKTVCEEKPPPFFINLMQEEAKKHGFIIDEADAERLLFSVDPSWFGDPGFFGGFIGFVITEKILKDKKYSLKPANEQRRLFRHLIFNAPNIREEYPLWFEKRKQEAAETELWKKREAEETERKVKIHAAMEAVPEFCEKCGGPLDDMLACLKCKVFYDFDEPLLKYQPIPMSAFAVEHAMKKYRESLNLPPNEENQDDIDF
jgi:hypothetical protein